MDNIQLISESNFEIIANPHEIYNYKVIVDIPANDTSGFVIKVCCDDRCMRKIVYFVDSEDTTYSYSINPRLVDMYNSREAIRQRAIDSLNHLNSDNGCSRNLH